MIKLSREFLEIINSISWLLMDAMWMLNSLEMSYAFIIPTVVSAFWLIFKEKNLEGSLVAFAALMWSVMNSIWLVGETMSIPGYLLACKICFIFGIGTLVTGLVISNDVTKTLNSFKRFKARRLLESKIN